eukprot:TRINITY_DN2184_c0_g2_i1.p1 TRINITY_DN2184_c0_g2~~TRINITY_DN2184_c0_g2_i1.p1  ORF type:complete len:213 (-),score=38.74 TRINITY_DN2184_c0_g2_i1:338-904(-)
MAAHIADEAQGGAEGVVNRMKDLHSKYKHMEASLIQKKAKLSEKLPELQHDLEMVEFLATKSTSEEPVSTHYQLSDLVYARATLHKPTHVGIWLGAKVMVEYSLDEAVELLNGNIASTKDKLRVVNEELEFTQEQLNRAYLNMTRAYNCDVQQRRKGRGTSQGLNSVVERRERKRKTSSWIIAGRQQT